MVHLCHIIISQPSSTLPSPTNYFTIHIHSRVPIVCYFQNLCDARYFSLPIVFWIIYLFVHKCRDVKYLIYDFIYPSCIRGWIQESIPTLISHMFQISSYGYFDKHIALKCIQFWKDYCSHHRLIKIHTNLFFNSSDTHHVNFYFPFKKLSTKCFLFILKGELLYIII